MLPLQVLKILSSVAIFLFRFKARKNHPLTPLQKAINHVLAPWRVAVENGIAQLKAFFILRIENRMRKKEKLADAFTLCAELAYFKSTHLTC